MAANTDSPLERRLRSQIKNDVVRFKSVMRRLFDAQISLEPYLRNVLDAKPEDTRAYELHAETAECLFGMAKALALSQGIVLSLGPFGHKRKWKKSVEFDPPSLPKDEEADLLFKNEHFGRKRVPVHTKRNRTIKQYREYLHKEAQELIEEVKSWISQQPKTIPSPSIRPTVAPVDRDVNHSASVSDDTTSTQHNHGKRSRPRSVSSPQKPARKSRGQTESGSSRNPPSNGADLTTSSNCEQMTSSTRQHLSPRLTGSFLSTLNNLNSRANVQKTAAGSVRTSQGPQTPAAKTQIPKTRPLSLPSKHRACPSTSFQSNSSHPNTIPSQQTSLSIIIPPADQSPSSSIATPIAPDKKTSANNTPPRLNKAPARVDGKRANSYSKSRPHLRGTLPPS